MGFFTIGTDAAGHILSFLTLQEVMATVYSCSKFLMSISSTQFSKIENLLILYEQKDGRFLEFLTQQPLSLRKLRKVSDFQLTPFTHHNSI